MKSGNKKYFLIIVFIIVFISSTIFLNHLMKRSVFKGENEINGGLVEHAIYVRPGEMGKTQYLVYTGRCEGTVRFTVYRVSRVGSTRKIATPNGLNISVNPEGKELKPHKKYIFNVFINTSKNLTGTYTFLIRVYINGNALDDWLRVMIAETPNPGFASLYLPRVKHVGSIMLKAGESAGINCTLYTGDSPPGIVKIRIYRVEDIYKIKEIPMLEGLNVSVAPSKLLVSPHRTYTFKIKVKTGSIPPGKYVFCITFSGCIGTETSWLTINVR